MVRLIEHARNGSSAKSYVQLSVAGSAGAEGSSAAADPDDGGRGSAGICRRSSTACTPAKAGRRLRPEKLLRAQLLQMLYSIRSERLLMEEIDYSVLFRWFVGLNLDEEVWDATTFTKNRDRLLEAEVAKQFLAQVVEQARAQSLTSDEHFTVDGTLLEAWAGAKSFQRKDKQETAAGRRRSRQSHGELSWREAVQPDARLDHGSRSQVGAQGRGQGGEVELQRQSAGGESQWADREQSMAWEATGTAERDTALEMLEKLPGSGRVTVGGDKGYDTANFVRECRNIWVTPHVAQNLGRRGGSAIDRRTTLHQGYARSQKKRKRIEECFGWLKTVALLRKVRHRGTLKVDWIFTFACAAYNLVRMRNLMRSAVAT